MRNSITEILKIKYPIIQGGMGNISDPLLAAAISNAGGLGTIGTGNLPISEISNKIKVMISNTTKPCCVNIPISVHPYPKLVAEEVIAHRVPVVSLSAGNPSDLIGMFHEHNIKVICVTSTVRQAKKAEILGANLIVCEGYEAAGINSPNESTTMTLIPQVAKEVSIPIVAAGGIADGKGFAAAIALGASGVQLGTRFVATKEANFHPNYKKSILKANDESTVIVGRSFKQVRRILKNHYAESLLNLENKRGSIEEYKEKTSEERHYIGTVEGNDREGFMTGGQIAGLIEDLPTVAEVMENMINEAKDILNPNYFNLSLKLI